MDSHGGKVTLETMSDFDALIDEWIAEELQESPVRATQLGIDGYDDQLGDYSAARFERREASEAEWLARLNALDASALHFDQRIDLGLLQSTLTGRTNAVVVARDGRPVGVLTRSDLLEYLAHKQS